MYASKPHNPSTPTTSNGCKKYPSNSLSSETNYNPFPTTLKIKSTIAKIYIPIDADSVLSEFIGNIKLEAPTRVIPTKTNPQPINL